MNDESVQCFVTSAISFHRKCIHFFYSLLLDNVNTVPVTFFILFRYCVRLIARAMKNNSELSYSFKEIHFDRVNHNRLHSWRMPCTFPYGASLSRRTCPNIYGIVAPFYSFRRLSPKRTPQSGRGPFWLCTHLLCASCITRWALSSQGAAICETLITADEYCTWTCSVDGRQQNRNA